MTPELGGVRPGGSTRESNNLPGMGMRAVETRHNKKQAEWATPKKKKIALKTPDSNCWAAESKTKTKIIAPGGGFGRSTTWNTQLLYRRNQRELVRAESEKRVVDS